MPHATTESWVPSRVMISHPFDTNKLNTKKLSKHIRKPRHDPFQQQPQDQQHGISTIHLTESDDTGNSNFLAPDDAITDISRGRSSSRFSLRRLNPFTSPSSPRSRRSSAASSRSRSRNGDEPSSPHVSPSPSFSPSRSNSPVRDERDNSYRSPLVNPSPATRRPRQPSPPPVYSQTVTAASGPTLGACPRYEEAVAAVPAAAATSHDNANTSSSNRSSRRSQANANENNNNNNDRSADQKDPLAFLSQFDTIFLIDDSASMWGRSWAEAEAALAAIAPVCTQYDRDGVDVYFLNHQSGEPDEGGSAGTGYRRVRSAAQVARLFRRIGEPAGGDTLTGMRLQRILQTYVGHYERRVAASGGDATCVRPINVIVVTDGEPTDEPGDVIRRFARRLDRRDAPPYQVGIQFFQVGDDDEAARALARLDDGLRRSSTGGEELRDMVDTVTFDGAPSGGAGAPTLTKDGILKAVLGAVIRRLDKTDLGAG